MAQADAITLVEGRERSKTASSQGRRILVVKNGAVEPGLGNIMRMAVVTTYGRTWWRARVLVGDPIRKQMTRAVRWYCHPSARCRYLALYDMNTASEARRKAFLARVERAMAAF